FISFFYRHATPQNKHSFPTRRSSDLTAKRKKRWVFTSPSSVEILPRARVPKGFGTSAAIIFNSANSPANERRAIDGFGIYRRCRSEEHTSELQSRFDLVCRLLLEKKN